MSEAVQTDPRIQLLPAAQVARDVSPRLSGSGVNYASFGETRLTEAEIEHIVGAVPPQLAAALKRRVYYFVPLAIHERRVEELPGEPPHRVPEETLISAGYSTELGDQATCHRNVSLGQSECVFISTRLMHDRFALSFEFFINIGHAFVDEAGVPASFSELVWNQALADVRGETSQDAWEARKLARANESTDEKSRLEFAEFAFSDAIAVYLLSLAVDFDYAELREREYPLLTPQALAERLKHIAALFPPNAGYEFAIKYRRR